MKSFVLNNSNTHHIIQLDGSYSKIHIKDFTIRATYGALFELIAKAMAKVDYECTKTSGERFADSFRFHKFRNEGSLWDFSFNGNLKIPDADYDLKDYQEIVFSWNPLEDQYFEIEIFYEEI